LHLAGTASQARDGAEIQTQSRRRPTLAPTSAAINVSNLTPWWGRRHTPGQDLTGQPAQVTAIANTVWTDEVVTKYQEMIEAQRLG